MPDPMLTGSGPFIFDSYVPENYVLLKANKNYFMPTRPKGDINFDKTVDIYDLIIVANAYAEYHPMADLNGDRQIDIYDLIIVATDFGKTWTPDP